MTFILVPIFQVLSLALNLAMWGVIFYAILWTLVGFGVVNRNNALVLSILGFLSALFEPILSRIRQKIPTFGAVDLSPLILILGIYFLQSLRTTAILSLLK